MDVQFVGVPAAPSGEQPEIGSLVTASLGTTIAVGIWGADQDGEYMVVLRGGVVEDDRPPFVISSDHLSDIAPVKGTLTIEGLEGDDPFAGEWVTNRPLGSLGFHRGNAVIIASANARSIGIKLSNGGESLRPDMTIRRWRLRLTPPGSDRLIDVVRFGE